MSQPPFVLSRFLGLILSLAIAGQAYPSEKPNIVVFLVDDMGLMDSSLPFLTDEEGNPERHPLNDFYRTPNMERLAKRGTRFSQFYAMSVCSPTRASIMNGQTSARHTTTQFIKPESKNTGTLGPADWKWEGFTDGDVTLPALLREAGYHTIHAGKAHFGPNDSYASDPTNLGFDVNIGGCAYGQPGSFLGTEHFGWAKKGREKRAVPGLEKYHGQDIYLTEALTLEINAAISKAVEEEKPFFAHMSHYAVHSPFQTDVRFAANYSETPEKKLASFATMIEGMDKSLGDMLDQLEELGIAENTLVMFLGDNGTDAPAGGVHEIACSAPLRAKKGTHYEGGMRVPFIAAWAKPNPKNGFQKEHPIAEDVINSTDIGAVYDVFTTVLEVAGVAKPENHVVDGMDLMPLFSEASGSAADREFLMHFPHSHRSSYFTAFRKGDWKLVYHYDKPSGPVKEQIELFHLSEDREESKNLAQTNPEKLQDMMQAMNASLQEASAQFPVDKTSGAPLKPTL
ncbi:MAG: sulfatase [Verrucomicrobiota bacterium]